jgi:hypothetical protein
MSTIDGPADEKQPSNLVDLNHHKAEAKKKRPPVKIKKMEVYKTIHHAMDGGLVKAGRFPAKFHIIRDGFGEHAYVEELENQVLRYVSRQRLYDVVAQFAEGFDDSNFELEPKKAKECAELWSMLQPIFTEEIAPIREFSDPGYTYYRIPFDFSEGETPLADDIISRTENGQALMSFIGSLFLAE